MLTNLLKIAFIVGFVIASTIRATYARRYKPQKVSDERNTGLDRFFLILPSLGMFFIPLIYILTPWLDFANYHLPDWAGWAGIVIFAFGLWLLWRSHTDLGRNWTTHLEIREEHTLVTNGVFRYIRHPMYAAHFVWGIAQILMLQNWIAGLSMLVGMLPLYLRRVPREEAMMIEQFGDDYRTYMQQTGRIFPRLGK